MIVRILISTLFFAASCVAQNAPLRPAVPDINGRATLLVKPEHSDAVGAFAADSNTLAVKVVVDATGIPVTAVCSATCHPAMKQAAERAALASRFEPLIAGGRAVEYEGTLLYTIAIKAIDWFRFGTALQSVLNFDNISVGPVAQFLTPEFAVEKARLTEIDQEKNVDERIRKIGAEIDHFTKRLSGKDRWIFMVGLATRNVTFWTMAGERIDREALRRSLKQVGILADGAPTEISKEFVSSLREISEFKFGPEIGERELRQEITKLSAKLRSYPR